jgi:Tol biopolymer transport system component
MSSEPNARGADPNYDIFVVNRDGTALRQLTSWPGEDGWPTWSPDGRRIVFTTTHGTVSERYDLWIMLADGSRKHRLTAGSFPVWSPDGRAIMFSTGDDDRLAVTRPDGSGLRTWPLRGELPDWHR